MRCRKEKQMKYIKPTYANEVIETSDIVLTSIIGGGEAKLEDALISPIR